MNRNIKTGIVLSLLLILPLISYLYLKRGFDYQINNLESIKAKGVIDEHSVDNTIFPFDSALNMVNMVLLWDDNFSNSDRNNLEKISRQYQDIDNWLGFVYYKAPGTTDAAFENIQTKTLNAMQWDRWLTLLRGDSLNVHAGTALILDIDNRIRNTYEFGKEEEVKKMIAHTALLFPKGKND